MELIQSSVTNAGSRLHQAARPATRQHVSSQAKRLPAVNTDVSVVTFEVRSDPGVVARSPPHQFVQEVRGRHRDLACPHSMVQLLTSSHAVTETQHT